MTSMRTGILILGLASFAVASAAAQVGTKPSAPQFPAPLKAQGDFKPAVWPGAGRLDVFGDPLPPQAIQRLGTSRFRHGSRILSAVFSPNGRILAAGGGDDPVRLWDTDTGRELVKLRDAKSKEPRKETWATAMVFSPLGSVLATANAFHTIRLWAVASGEERFQLKGHTTPITCLAISEKGMLASAGTDGSIRLWELLVAEEITQLRGHTGEVNALCFSPDSSQLASAGSDRTVRVWDVQNARLVLVISTDSPVAALAFSSDGKTLITAGDDAVVRLWEAESGKPSGQLTGHKDVIGSLLVSRYRDVHKQTHERLVSLSRDRTIRTWDLANRAVVHVISCHAGDCDALAVSSDGKVLVAAGQNNTLRRWEADTGKEILPTHGHQSPVAALAVSPDGRSVVSLSSKATVRLWEGGTGKELRHWRLRESNGEQPPPEGTLAFSPDGQSIAVGWGGEPVRIYDLMGRAKQQLAGSSDPVLSLVFSPDGKTLAVGHEKQIIRLWDCGEGKVRFQIKYPGPVHALAFSQDGQTLAASGGPHIALYQVGNGELVRELATREGPPLTPPFATCLAFAPDGKSLATGWLDGIVRLWNTATGKEIRQFEGHGSAIHGLAFSADGRNIVSASFDRTVRLWEAYSGRQIASWQGHAGPATSVAFARDGRVAVSGSADTTLLLWDVTGLSPEGKLPRLILDAPALQNAWQELALDAAPQGNHALWNLVAAHQQGVTFLAGQVFLVDPAHVRTLLRDLNNPSYIIRTKATKELARNGMWMKNTLQDALKNPESEEVRRRLEELLKKLEIPNAVTIQQERLRVFRVLQVLEQTALPESVDLLRKMSLSAPEEDLRQEAQTALRRLTRR
jgi:WD40 repeat protein